MNITTGLLSAVALSIAPLPPESVDVPDVSFGMTVEEVTSVLKANGFNVASLPSGGRGRPKIYFSKSKASPSGLLSFCEERLAGYSPSTPPSKSPMVEFIGRIHELDKRLGPSTYTTSAPVPSEAYGMSLTHWWRTPSEVVKLSFTPGIPGVSDGVGLGFVQPGSCQDWEAGSKALPSAPPQK